jgi:hypothetical protein
MPCGLEDRARFFPRLDSLRQETPHFNLLQILLQILSSNNVPVRIVVTAGDAVWLGGPSTLLPAP